MTQLPDDPPAFDVQPVLDAQTRVAPHLPLLVLMTLIMLIDGYDVFMLGKIAPAMARDFGEPITALTLIFVLQQAGLAIGSFAVGPLSDRFGRKRVLLLCTIVFGLLTLAPIWAATLRDVAILRGVAGLFLAGVIPNAAAMLTECAPPRRRAAFVAIAFSGYTAGGALASLVTIGLLDRYGWESAFVIGGVVPLVLAPIFALATDESLQFRIRRDPGDPRIKAALLRIDPTLDLGHVDRFALGSEAARRAAPRQGDATAVLRDGRAPMTLALWLTFFLALGLISLLGAWMATFFNVLGGVPLSRWAAFSLIGFTGGLAGTTSIGFLMDRFGRIRMLLILFAGDALAIMLLGTLPFASSAFIVALVVWGYCQAGGQAGINAICAQAYPTGIRASGVGWAFGMGRVGGIAMPALGGLMIASGASLAQVFLVAGLIPVLIAGALVAVHRGIGTRTLGH
ncbi:MFS transporter [Sphingomonas baiyangensis]|uniref:MFS transporter n=1 Tax=Sphingomonas baiyangensis TaxID=2572576 RepID=UPI00146E8864|nr:MFS transporter [Sphingomonas baiyangensis]